MNSIDTIEELSQEIELLARPYKIKKEFHTIVAKGNAVKINNFIQEVSNFAHIDKSKTASILANQACDLKKEDLIFKILEIFNVIPDVVIEEGIQWVFKTSLENLKNIRKKYPFDLNERLLINLISRSQVEKFDYFIKECCHAPLLSEENKSHYVYVACMGSDIKMLNFLIYDLHGKLDYKPTDIQLPETSLLMAAQHSLENFKYLLTQLNYPISLMEENKILNDAIYKDAKEILIHYLSWNKMNQQLSEKENNNITKI